MAISNANTARAPLPLPLISEPTAPVSLFQKYRPAIWAAMPLVILAWIYVRTTPERALLVWGIYVAVVSLQYFFLGRWANRKDSRSLIPMYFPLLVLVTYKSLFLLNHYVGFSRDFMKILPEFLGISYLTFRLSLMAMEIRNVVAPLPGFFEYLGYAFFAPLMWVGPIASYRTMVESARKNVITTETHLRSLSRILVGAVKFYFLSVITSQTYFGLTAHNPPVYPLAYAWLILLSLYFQIYLEFSGVCDIAIGVSGILGISIEENFEIPFLARNIQEFWNRWHITLSTFLRDLVFTPVSKSLLPYLGRHAVVPATFCVFVGIGLWHGIQRRYVYFGLAHASAITTVYYYGLLLRRYLTREQLKAYQQNPWIRSISTALTFVFVAMSFYLIYNSPERSWYYVKELWGLL